MRRELEVLIRLARCFDPEVSVRALEAIDVLLEQCRRVHEVRFCERTR